MFDLQTQNQLRTLHAALHSADNEACELGQNPWLRDQFAGQAMQALIGGGIESDAWEGYDELANSAYRIADAMLRAKGN